MLYDDKMTFMLYIRPTTYLHIINHQNDLIKELKLKLENQRLQEHLSP